MVPQSQVVEVAPPPVTNVVDTTGAGDAFLGGLIVGLTNNGLPDSTEDLRCVCVWMTLISTVMMIPL